MFEVWSVFWMRNGVLRGVIGMWCHHTKAQSMQFTWAPESMIVVVSMSFIVRGEMMNFSFMYSEFFHWGLL